MKINELITEQMDIWTAAQTPKRNGGRGRTSNGNGHSSHGIKKLRELILELAVRGKLVPQDPDDEPASVLLERIAKEKRRLIKEGKIKKQKPLPEVGEDEKPFELPKGWEIERFGNLTFNKDAERIPLSVDERKGRQGEYDYYGASGIIDTIDDYLFDKPLLLIGEDGANLINRSTPIAFIARGKYWVNNHAHVIDGITEGFLQYICLHINAISLEPYVTGTAQPKMNQAKMNSIVLAIPPLPEQHRIVTKVNELMTLCDQLEQQQTHSTETHQTLVSALLATLTQAADPKEFDQAWQRIAHHFDTLFTTEAGIDQLKQTLLQLAVMGKLVPQDPNDEPASALLEKIAKEKKHLIKEGKIKKQKPLPEIGDDEKPFELPQGWAVALIDKFCHVQGGIQKQPKRIPKKNHHPYLRVANVQRGYINVDEMERFELEEGELEKWALKSGDILVVEGNGSEDEIGRCAIWDGQIEDCVYQNHLIRVRPYLKHLEYFVSKYLNSPSGIEGMKRLSVTTSGLYNLSVGKIRAIPIPIPPLKEQARILAKIEELMTLCDKLKARLNQAQTTQLQLADAIVEQAVA